MSSDLPILPDEVRAELDALTPEAVAAPPACDPGDLTVDKLELIRDWLHALRHSNISVLKVLPLSDEQLDQSITSIVSDHRSIGIDLRAKRDLLVTYFGLQLNLIMVQRDWAECGDIHTYIHFARPLSNLALAYELLLLEVFGEEAAFFPEGGE